MKRKTIHLKVKSESCSWLNRAAVEVNQIWNYSRAVSMKALETSVERPKATWLSSFDLNNLTSGMTEFQEKTGADTIQMVCKEYAEKRRAEKKRSLRWRISKGAKRSLGWVPFKAANVKVKGNSVRFCGKTFRVFDLQRLLEYGTRKSGSFSQNSLGEWWLNVVVEMPDAPLAPTGKSVGIDLGLKSVATCSDGFKLDASQFYRKMEGKIGSAQRRGHKKQAKRLHMKVANQRKDALHKFSRKLVDENDLIVIGDVSSSKLTKT
ncbi:MAG: RNA-guided endonuclease InsQ/TnpB family protein, partial [Ktedonobacteraceae bacterium]